MKKVIGHCVISHWMIYEIQKKPSATQMINDTKQVTNNQLHND